MKSVTQLIAGKSSEIWTVDPAQPVLDAIKCMAEKNIGALLVTKDAKLVGIISERAMPAKLYYGVSHPAKHPCLK